MCPCKTAINLYIESLISDNSLVGSLHEYMAAAAGFSLTYSLCGNARGSPGSRRTQYIYIYSDQSISGLGHGAVRAMSKAFPVRCLHGARSRHLEMGSHMASNPGERAAQPAWTLQFPLRIPF